ncbi:MAG TPA: phage tail sheath subtilisin-like domain-containing protein [Pyrinomonadaceae bacterium]
MWTDDKVPGVYKSEDVVAPGPQLPTGVPGFIGFTSAPGADSLHTAVVLHRKDDLRAKSGKLPPIPEDGFLAEAVNGFFLNGGVRCHVVYAAAADPEESVKDALDALARLDDIDLIAVPDAMSLTPEDVRERVQRIVLEYCREHPGRMAILDALPQQNQAGIKEQRHAISLGMPEPINGALYYPWIKTVEGKLVPPCGHVAGIYARSDARVGVFKAPANEEVKGALDLEFSLNDQSQAELNPLGINCLRSFPGRGIRIWGARTLSSDPDWRYINVRRLFLTLRRWIDLNMGWTSFEPNTPTLWVRIERELASYLSQLWLAGALAGQSADEAFYIKCDIETNPPETESAGQVFTEIGLAVSAPAEFVKVRVVHHTGVDPR